MNIKQGVKTPIMLPNIPWKWIFEVQLCENNPPYLFSMAYAMKVHVEANRRQMYVGNTIYIVNVQCTSHKRMK
jgi:hypothetical protein